MLVMFLKTMSFDVDITGIGSGFVTELCTMSMSIFKLALVGVFAKPAAAQMVEQINDMGNNALWVAFFGLFLSTTYFYYATMQQPEGKRYFHVLTTAITAIASLAYLVMAMGYGVVDVGGRPFYYARYVDWTFTTPLLLVDLCGFAGVGFELTFLLVAADVLMIVAGAVGAFIEGTEKYAFFAFSMLAFIPIIYFLAFTLKGKAHVTGANAASVFGTTSTLTILTWSAYPIVWVFAEGTRTISPDLECVIYAVLDLIAKSIFGFVVISARDAIGESIRVLSSAEKATGYGAISDA